MTIEKVTQAEAYQDGFCFDCCIMQRTKLFGKQQIIAISNVYNNIAQGKTS